MKNHRRSHRPVLDTLENRQLLAAVLDPTFAGGMVERLPQIKENSALAVGRVIHPYPLADGKTLLVVQAAETTTLIAGGGVAEPLLIRLNADGSPDTTFGANGQRFLTPDSNPAYPLNFRLTASALQSDGKIVLFGDSGPPRFGPIVPTALRLNPDASVDPTFQYSGTTTASSGLIVDGAGLAVTPTGSVYIVATEIVPGQEGEPYYNREPRIVRLLPDGSTDPGFGTNGKVVIADRGNGYDFSSLVATQGESLVMALYQGVSRVFRFTPQGTLDPSFASDGVAYFNSNYYTPPNTEVGRSLRPRVLKLDLLGRIVIAGQTTDLSDGPQQVSIARLTATGQPDATFGALGLARFAFDPAGMQPQAVGFRADGQILVAGAATSYDKRYLLGVLGVTDTGGPDLRVGPGGASVAPVEDFVGYSPSTTLLTDSSVSVDPMGRVVIARIGIDPLGKPDVVVGRVVTMEPPTGPVVTTFVPVVAGAKIRMLRLTFSDAMQPATAGRKAAYRLVSAGRDGEFGTRDDRVIRLARVRYRAAAKTVTLRLGKGVPKRGHYRLIARGTALTDLAGHSLAGGNFVATF